MGIRVTFKPSLRMALAVTGPRATVVTCSFRARTALPLSSAVGRSWKRFLTEEGLPKIMASIFPPQAPPGTASPSPLPGGPSQYRPIAGAPSAQSS